MSEIKVIKFTYSPIKVGVGARLRHYTGVRGNDDEDDGRRSRLYLKPKVNKTAAEEHSHLFLQSAKLGQLVWI